MLASLAAIEFGLAGHGYRGSTAADVHQDLPNPRAATDRTVVVIPVSAFLGAPATAPPAANLLAFVAQNSSRRPRSRRPGWPGILRGDAVLMVVGEAEICVLEPAWMARQGLVSVLSGLLTRL